MVQRGHSGLSWDETFVVYAPVALYVRVAINALVRPAPRLIRITKPRLIVW
jgi:hypothetical protein